MFDIGREQTPIAGTDRTITTSSTEQSVALPMPRDRSIGDLARTLTDRDGILDFGPPLTGDGVVDAAADRPTGA
ncbi:hypothetical protein BKA03_002600 [Demequina lutea]|uniref:Uncharacterized protein n=1 Tax=Demequina lutea TaxID=431489 RepID=A0A7Z0CIE4_9MICO|nr:hypothetical protein [Demequina lutea]NYI42481.1 hypothetical protein [Demequina lutea]